MFCKNGAVICDDCGLFTKWEGIDVGTPFGTKDYEDPEPLDEEHFCPKHAQEHYEEAMEHGLLGRSGYWEKPAWEVRAAKDQGLTYNWSTYRYE